jgi:hypothetical protein
MTNFQLLSLCQATAASSVLANETPFATVKSAVAAFTTTGHADAGWPEFNQTLQRELQSYRAAAQKDAALATATAAAKPALTSTAPASLAVAP